jgi:hypothetical protein
MSDSAIAGPPIQGKTEPVDERQVILWGAEEIGKTIRRNKRQTHHMLDRGLIKSARKVGGLWCVNRAALLREFGGE